MAVVEIGGRRYSIGKIPPMTQFHIARRLAPMVAGGAALIDVIDAVTRDDVPLNEAAEVLKNLQPVAEALAKMPDADAEYVVNHCLLVVSRQEEPAGNWAPVQPQLGMMMMADMTMPDMLRLAFEVIKDQIAPFLNAQPSDLPAEPQLAASR